MTRIAAPLPNDPWPWNSRRVSTCHETPIPIDRPAAMLSRLGPEREATTWSRWLDLRVGHDGNVALVDTASLPAGASTSSPFAQAIGYASGPLLYAATAKKIPALIQEQNSYAGLTNKWLGEKAKKVCVAYDGMERFFPREKIVITGNPVRKDMVNIEGRRQEALSHFGLSASRKVLFAMGGSLGARMVNESILAGLQVFIDANVQLIWQVGKFYFDEIKEKDQKRDDENTEEK